MVYRKGNLSVLLGPEHLQNDSGQETERADCHQKTQSARRPGEPFVFGKVPDSNVYKRTKPVQVQVPRPKLDRYPSGLELSGQKVDDNKAKSAREKPTDSQSEQDKAVPDMDTASQFSKDTGTQFSKESTASLEKPYTPSFHKSKTSRLNYSANSTVSKNFLTDFGLRSERTDTFSGHSRRRGVAGAEIERQMQEKAKRHIRTCQTVGNVKRSSKAQRGYQGLRDTVSPTHTPLSFYPKDGHPRHGLKHKHFFKSDSSLDKTSGVPFMVQIRKNVGTISRQKVTDRRSENSDPLPEISGRTLILGSGFDI